MLQRKYPRALHFSCIIPPSIAFYFHSQYDSREISTSEINLSHTKLAALSYIRKNFVSVTQSATTAKERQLAQNRHLWNLLYSDGVMAMPKFLNDNQTKVWSSNLDNAINNKKINSRVRNNRGRLHCHQESRKDPYNDHFRNLVSSSPELQTIVKEYFQRHSIKRYQLTQTQFLLAKPGSEHQIWHRDNIAPGLTLLVALDNVKSNGPTEFLIGTHSKEYDTFHDNNEVLLGCLEAGDAILYDARLIHRGRGYKNNGSSDRPVLILRWDSTSTPPPGVGLIVTNYVDWLGSFRAFTIEALRLIKLAFGDTGR